MADITSPSADTLVRRAILLRRLGKDALARNDIAAALGIDPMHPNALALGARLIDPHYAIDLLKSATASEKHRKSAIRSLAKDTVATLFCTAFPATLRVTIIWTPSDTYQVIHGQPEDTVSVLGKGKSASGMLLVTDHYLQRTAEPRSVEIVFKGETHQISVPKLDRRPQNLVSVDQPAAHPWVIVPVFNAPDALKRCLTSLLTDLDETPTARALLLDDASTDTQVSSLLENAAQHPQVSVLFRQENQGFTATVNAGLLACGAGPVLLLNADTYLPKGTLARMTAHLAEDIATVTPLTNNGGSFTIPQARKSFHMPTPPEAKELADHAAKMHKGLAADVITGNGFAMLISERARVEVGLLSPAYESGYYEEVDFCLRASERGMRHVAALDCFVAHEGSQSYGTEKKRLVSENQKRLLHRFSGYTKTYQAFQALDPLRPYGEALLAISSWRPTLSAPQEDTPSSPVLAPRLLHYQGPTLSAVFLEQFQTVVLCDVAVEKMPTGSKISAIYNAETGHLEASAANGTCIAALDLRDASPPKIAEFEKQIVEYIQ